jgi:RNA polymerase sigma-70 factor, ECF subfamily
MMARGGDTACQPPAVVGKNPDMTRNFRGEFRVGHLGAAVNDAVNDDAQYISQTLSGNRAAFGELVRKYQARLLNALFHVIGNREEAEDVAQEALMQALLKLDSFRQQSTFYTWLYRIAFNTWVTRRRRGRHEVSMDQIRERTGEEPLDAGAAPSERVIRDEQARQVWVAMHALQDEHRAILVLREIEGCRYETIAEILDLPVGTVRSRLHRARLQLRDQLQGVLQENLSE